jgi:hypothetical protein
MRIMTFPNTSKNWTVYLLASLASLSILSLRLSGSSDRIWLSCEFAMVWFVAFWIRWQSSQKSKKNRPLEVPAENPSIASRNMPFWSLSLGAIAILSPWLSSIVQIRLLGSSGEANELIWLAMLQYAALWGAAIAEQDRSEWLSFLMSCFLVIFGLATSDRPNMIQLVIPFAAVACWWLMAKYWNSIERGFVASESVPLIRMRALVLGSIALIAGITLAVVTKQSIRNSALDGFMPTSGGQKRGESWSRQGVGDGDMLVAAKDEAYTFGPVDSDLFLDSEVPSMYDMVSEMYGEPTPRQRQYARAISLENQAQELEEEGTESQKNSREFSALRQPNKNTQNHRPTGSDSRAVLQLVGRTPQWLRLESYDRFSENTWSHSENIDLSRRHGEPTLESIAGKPWMRLQSFTRDLVFPVHERIATKVIQFKSSRLLSPSLITFTHIDRIDQPDFFGWTRDGQLMMPNREHVPQLTVVHQLLQIPQLHPLRDPAHPLSNISHLSRAHTTDDWIQRYTHVESNSARIRSTLDEWFRVTKQESGQQTTDWQRIETIVRNLRHFKHDNQFVPPADCTDAIAYVLEKKCAPDYLIASTAVMLIRKLGIPCRLCTGFFASPTRYDARAGQTEVLPEDLHTWAEVYIHGMWIPIEPTGSYPQPREHRSWQQWAIQTAWLIRDTIRTHPVACALIACGLGLAFYLRRSIVFGVSCLVLMPVPILSESTKLRLTLRLLGWRAWLWNRHRAPRTTLHDWLSGQLKNLHRAENQDITTFIRSAQRLAYGPNKSRLQWNDHETRAIRNVYRSLLRSGLDGSPAPRPIHTSKTLESSAHETKSHFVIPFRLRLIDRQPN